MNRPGFSINRLGLPINRPGFAFLVLFLLAGCGRKAGETPPAAGQGGAAETAEAARAEALKKVAADPSRPEEERVAAAIERARLLGREVPASLLAGKTPAERVEIALPDGPPSPAAVADGEYLLSIAIEYEGRPRVEDRLGCDLKRSGETVEIRLRRQGGAVFAGTLREGRLTADGTETGASFHLEGQVTGPGKLAGSVTGGSETAGIRIREGRWSLERKE